MYNYQDYQEIIKNYLDSYHGEYNKIIDYSPVLLKLLTDILNEKVLSSEHRLKICAALGYFLAPLDVIPESIYGPDGFIDDIFVCCYVLRGITNEFGFDFVESLWESDEEFETVLENCYTQSETILGDKHEFVLKYVGLK